MSLTLNELRVADGRFLDPHATRPASLADLVEVLKQEGAWIETEPGIGVEWAYTLVLPLEDTPK